MPVQRPQCLASAAEAEAGQGIGVDRHAPGRLAHPSTFDEHSGEPRIRASGRWQGLRGFDRDVSKVGIGRAEIPQATRGVHDLWGCLSRTGGHGERECDSVEPSGVSEIVYPR